MIKLALHPRSKLDGHFDAFKVEDKGFLGYMPFHMWLSKIPMVRGIVVALLWESMLAIFLVWINL